MTKKYRVVYYKNVRRWTVQGEDWVCDCIDKETAQLIAKLLNENANM